MALNFSPETAFTDDQREAAPPPAPAELAPRFPQLEILELLGRGGMGAVYKARQRHLDRWVALKILPPSLGQDPSFAERFEREAKALAKLSHPGIVTLYEFGQADGLFYFLMEFVDGVNLRHLLEAGRLSPREALAIVPQICDALQYAHDQGIVHRDIKPENILLDRQGRVKVADFGLAKIVGTDALTPALSHPMGEGETSAPGEGTPSPAAFTDAGKVMGTPQYMAPEQREHPTEVDHRADIYSLGVVFYQMLTGELPGKPIEAPSGKVQIDVRLDEVVLRALEKEPARRYQQVSQVKTAVETIDQSPGPARLANRTDNSAPRLVKGGASFVTTPEQLGTFDGQLCLWRRRCQLLLDDRQLTVAYAGAFTFIPLAAICDLSVGHYPRVMNPAGLDFISVTYDADGQTQRLLLSPYESWFGLPSNFNRIVAEWFAAIRAAVVTATGREPGNTPAEQLGVPSGFKGASLLLLLLLGGTWLVGGLLMGQRAGDAATHSLPGGRAMSIFAMLALAVGFIAFLVVRAGRKAAAETISSSSSPVPGTAPSPARPAATRGRLRAALMVGVLVWLFVTGTVTLITWIRAESWKVVAVLNCPLKLPPGRPVDDHFKFTATMIELIRSDVILGRVIDRLQLDERWERRNKEGLKLSKAQTMVLLKRRLDVRSEGGTLIQVGVLGKRLEEPEEAMEIANTIGEELRAFRLEQHDSPADLLEMTLRYTAPDILLGIAAGLVVGLLAGGLVLWRGFMRRGSQARPVKTAVETTAMNAPSESRASAASPTVSATASPRQTSWWPPIAMGGRRGERVIHWPGLLLLSGSMVVAALLLIPAVLLGVWLLTGSSEDPGSPSAPTSAFGPEIQQVLGAVEGDTTHWLDLDTGRQMSLSFPDDETAKQALFRTNGLDVMGLVTPEDIGVACREMVVRQVEGSRWDRATAEEIVSETASVPAGSGANAVLVFTTSSQRRATMFFRTRDGGHGVLQVFGRSENPLGVKIRYKLIQRGEGTVKQSAIRAQPADRAVPEASELSDASGTPIAAPKWEGKLTRGAAALPTGFNGVWPWFRGPNLNAISTDPVPLARSWPAMGPAPLWKIAVGEGFAAAAVFKGRVYVMDSDDEVRRSRANVLRCLSLADGREIWRFNYSGQVKRNHGVSRTIPAVTEKHVVALGPQCHLMCCDAVTGELRWHIDLVHEFNVTVPEWYAGQCPLVDGDRLILGTGGDALMIAVDLATGKPVWKTPNPRHWQMTHSSITPVEFMGRRMYVYCASGGVAGVAADDGRLLWETTDWTVKMANIPAPVDVGAGRIFLTGGTDAGSLMIQLREVGGQFAVERLFRLTAETFGAAVHTPILYQDHLFGVRQDGQLVCLDLNGKPAWESGAANRFGNGPLLMAQGLILVMNDDGLLTLAEASTSAFRKLTQARVLNGHEAWGPMALADGRLILRDLNQMICLDVAAK